MTKEEQITYLKDFIARWNKSSDAEKIRLCAEYDVFTADCGYPLVAADELLKELTAIKS
jgi:hypothetical protein